MTVVDNVSVPPRAPFPSAAFTSNSPSGAPLWSGGSYPPGSLPEVTFFLGFCPFPALMLPLHCHLPWEHILNELKLRRWREPVILPPSLQPMGRAGTRRHWRGVRKTSRSRREMEGKERQLPQQTYTFNTIPIKHQIIFGARLDSFGFVGKKNKGKESGELKGAQARWKGGTEDPMARQRGPRGKPPSADGQSTACLALGPEAAEASACLWKGNGASDSSRGSCSQIWTLLRSSHIPLHPLHPLLPRRSHDTVPLVKSPCATGLFPAGFFFFFLSLQWLRLDRNSGMSSRLSKGPDPQPP